MAVTEILKKMFSLRREQSLTSTNLLNTSDGYFGNESFSAVNCAGTGTQGRPSPQTAMAQPFPSPSLSSLPLSSPPSLPFSPFSYSSFLSLFALPSRPSFSLLSETVNRSPQIYNNTLKFLLFGFFVFPLLYQRRILRMLNTDWTPLLVRTTKLTITQENVRKKLIMKQTNWL